MLGRTGKDGVQHTNDKPPLGLVSSRRSCDENANVTKIKIPSPKAS